jgi:uncharacterized protein YycO
MLRELLQKIRSLLLSKLHPIVKWVGEAHMPWSRKKITGIDLFEVLEVVAPGMVFLTKTHGELTNLFIPGNWSHVGIYTGDNTVVEAVGRGVIERDLASFLLTKDEACLLTPIFASFVKMESAATWCERQIGAPYDYNFYSNNNAFYCSELVYNAYKAVCPLNDFALRERLGVKTVLPDDFFKAKEKWREVWGNYQV